MTQRSSDRVPRGTRASQATVLLSNETEGFCYFSSMKVGGHELKAGKRGIDVHSIQVAEKVCVEPASICFRLRSRSFSLAWNIRSPYWVGFAADVGLAERGD